jgi:hypothetical protein
LVVGAQRRLLVENDKQREDEKSFDVFTSSASSSSSAAMSPAPAKRGRSSTFHGCSTRDSVTISEISLLFLPKVNFFLVT